MSNTEKNEIILEVNNLKVYYPVLRGVFQKKVADVKAVDNVSFKLRRGETLGLVGESGCGKTTIGRTILGLIKPTAGKIIFEGKDISGLSEQELRPIRSKIALVFQDPFGSLNPRQNAGSIIGEPLHIHHLTSSKVEYDKAVKELFELTGLDTGMTDRFPHEFSGGQKQRIGLARALASRPSLIVCDEPVSALDVSIQAQIINLLENLQDGLRGLTYLFISHDLSVVRHISDRVAVMYLGHIVELTESRTLYKNPLHPYTRSLLSAIPIPDPFIEEKRERIILKGEVPSPLNPPPGCPFHPRCFMAAPECSQSVPPLRDIGGGHEVACLRV